MGSLRRRQTGNSWLWRERDADGTTRQRSAFLGPCETLAAAADHWRSEVTRLQAAHAGCRPFERMRRLRIEDDLVRAQERLAAVMEAQR